MSNRRQIKDRLRGLLFFLAGLFLSGCAHLPFEPVKLNSVDTLDANVVVEKFKNETAQHFSILESVVFRYRRRELTALGYSTIDEKEGLLSVAAVTPLGVKIFEIKDVKGVSDYSFALPKMTKNMDQGSMAKAMIEDVQHIYFGRYPVSNAEVRKLKGRIRFRQVFEEGHLEFFFGGPDNYLIEKQYWEEKKKVWTARYFDYKHLGSKIYPSKIYFQQHVRKYSLALRLKEVLA